MHTRLRILLPLIAVSVVVAGAAVACSDGALLGSGPTSSGPTSSGPTDRGPTASDGSGPASADAWGVPLFVEQFDGKGVDPTNWWIYDKPNAEPFPRSADRATVAGGALRLTGGFDSTGRDLGAGIANKMNLRYGRWEARVRVERGDGYSGVILLWPASGNWPTDGEIDLLEAINGNRQGASSFVHNGPRNHVEWHYLPGDYTQWQTIAVEWLPRSITFYLNGVPEWRVTTPAVPGAVNPIPSTSAMHLALQLDKGCTGAIPCRNSRTPATVTMYVDQVRIWAAPPRLTG